MPQTRHTAGLEETLEDRSSPSRATPVRASPHLFVVLECGRPLAGGARYALDEHDEILLGRGPERRAARSLEGHARRIKVTVPDPRMSSAHGKVTWNGESWAYEDLGSKNGSLLNGARVTSATLRDGDVLQVGHTLVVLRAALPTPSGSKEDVDTADLISNPSGARTLVPSLGKELQRLRRVSRTHVSVLLRGQTGTGKEVLARAVHALSGAKGPLVAVNCGAIPAALVESSLFGHTKGAFSGAVRDELGLVRAADRGTLFLDEVGDLPLAAQAALLRVLQEGEVVPVGTTRALSVDVRVIAATHRPIEQMAERGEFRADFLARLSGLTFALPALRDRREDLGLLIAELLPRYAPADTTLDPEAALALLTYAWPHNVRELEKVISLAAALAEDGCIALGHLPPHLARALGDAAPPAATSDEAPEEAQLRATIVTLLETHRGNVTEVSKAMGKARPLVHKWMKRLRIDPDVYRR